MGALFCMDTSQNYLSLSTPPPPPSPLLHTHAQSSSVLVLLVGTPVSSPRPFKCPRCLSATPTGPGCPGSSPSFRPPTSQLAQAHSLEVVLSLQAPSQGGISTPWRVLNPSCSTRWRGTNVWKPRVMQKVRNSLIWWINTVPQCCLCWTCSTSTVYLQYDGAWMHPYPLCSTHCCSYCHTNMEHYYVTDITFVIFYATKVTHQ